MRKLIFGLFVLFFTINRGVASDLEKGNVGNSTIVSTLTTESSINSTVETEEVSPSILSGCTSLARQIKGIGYGLARTTINCVRDYFCVYRFQDADQNDRYGCTPCCDAPSGCAPFFNRLNNGMDSGLECLQDFVYDSKECVSGFLRKISRCCCDKDNCELMCYTGCFVGVSCLKICCACFMICSSVLIFVAAVVWSVYFRGNAPVYNYVCVANCG